MTYSAKHILKYTFGLLIFKYIYLKPQKMFMWWFYSYKCITFPYTVAMTAHSNWVFLFPVSLYSQSSKDYMNLNVFLTTVTVVCIWTEHEIWISFLRKHTKPSRTCLPLYCFPACLPLSLKQIDHTYLTSATAQAVRKLPLQCPLSWSQIFWHPSRYSKQILLLASAKQET